MDVPKPTNPLDKMLPIIAQAVAEWQATNTPEKLRQSIHALLDKNSKEITMKLLGFNSNYGSTWQLDHCNGRNGNSAAGEYLRQVQADAIKEWLDKVPLPEFGAKQSASITKKIQSEYEYELSRQVRNKTIHKASADALAITDATLVSNHIGDYLKLMNLINPEPNKES